MSIHYMQLVSSPYRQRMGLVLKFEYATASASVNISLLVVNRL